MIARKSRNTPKSDFRGPKIGIWAKSEILNCFLCSVHPSVRLQKKRAGDIGTFQDMTFSNKPTSIQPESFLPERFLKGEQGGFTKPAHFQVLISRQWGNLVYVCLKLLISWYSTF